MAKTDIYEIVTAKILGELEAGAAPWVKPWSGRAGGAMPRNAVTDRGYSGVNVPLLWMAQDGDGYASPRWLTFKQALDAGGNVRKGERGCTVVFASAIEKTDDDSDGKVRRISFLKRFTVFNVAQCEGLPERIAAGEPVAPLNPDQRAALADEFMQATGAAIAEGTGAAYYRTATDYIHLPAFETFRSADHFYATAFHELGHWTGHKSRLDRSLRGRFGDSAYAAEELIAELCAAFLCAEFGFDGDLRHAGYIASWIELLKADSRAFFTASAKAQQAADFLRAAVLAAPNAQAA